MAFRDKSILDLPKINDTTDFWVLGSKQGTTPGQTLSGRYPLSIIAMGFVLKGYKANEAAIKAVINPVRGDAYRALDTGHLWVFDGTEWNDVGIIGLGDMQNHFKIISNKIYLFAIVDIKDRVLFGIYRDGTNFIPKGIPDDVVKTLLSYVKMEDVVKTLSDSDSPIAASAIPMSIIQDNIYDFAFVDNKKRVLFARKKNGTFYPEIVGNSAVSSNRFIQNNLRNQNDSELLLVAGTYGSSNAVYKANITGKTSRIVFDFFINEDVNTGYEDKAFATIVHSDGKTTELKIAKRDTSLLFSKPRTIQQNILQQQPKYNSGFYVGDIFIDRLARFKEPLIGEDVISLWYKPVFQDTSTVTEQMVRDRADTISQMRDLAVVMQEDTFSIIRDGLDVIDSLPEFNGGATSVIFSTSLKDGSGNWKTLRAFYEELKNAPALADFDIKFYALSYRKNCGDLLQFGKIKLVGLYAQKFTYEGSVEFLYDSFPTVLKFSVDNKKHTCEIVYVNDMLYVAIDGDMISKPTKSIGSVLVGGNSNTSGLITPFDLVVNDGNTGDAEVIVNPSQSRIVSERTPYSVGFLGHELADLYEPQAQGFSSMKQSLSRMEDVIIALQKRGYSIINIDELNDYVSGNKKAPKRSAYFIFDDRRVGEVYETLRVRQSISKYGAKANIATPSKYYYDNNVDDRYFKTFTVMRGNGWNCVSHTYYHNVPYPLKPSIILQNELTKILEVSDILNMTNNSLVYSYWCEWDNVYTLLRINGFALAIENATYESSVASTNRYCLSRCDMTDDGLWSVIDNTLI